MSASPVGFARLLAVVLCLATTVAFATEPVSRGRKLAALPEAKAAKRSGPSKGRAGRQPSSTRIAERIVSPVAEARLSFDLGLSYAAQGLTGESTAGGAGFRMEGMSPGVDARLTYVLGDGWDASLYGGLSQISFQSSTGPDAVGKGNLTRWNGGLGLRKRLADGISLGVRGGLSGRPFARRTSATSIELAYTAVPEAGVGVRAVIIDRPSGQLGATLDASHLFGKSMPGDSIRDGWHVRAALDYSRSLLGGRGRTMLYFDRGSQTTSSYSLGSWELGIALGASFNVLGM